MEPISVVAATLTALLVPYFTEAGKAFTAKVGEAAFAKCEAIYQTIKSYFQAKPSSSEALEDLKINPGDEDNQAAFRKELRKAFEGDEAFLQQLSQLLAEAKQAGLIVSGSGAIATSGGTAAGAGGIAVGGNVEGGIHFKDDKEK